MRAATWRMVVRSLPGPVALAVWLLVTVPVPLVFFEWTHRWEDDPTIGAALWWTVGAAPVLAAVVAAEWTWRSGPRRTGSALVAAVVAATLISAVFVGTTAAVYLWVIPLTGLAPWRSVFGSVLLAVCGAAVGHLLARGRARPDHVATRRGYVTGAIVAMVGALLGQATVQFGAEGSTVLHDSVEYGAVGPYAAPASQSGELRLPAAGRYAIFAVGSAPHDPDCQVTGVDQVVVSATVVTIAPGDYGGDFASYAWVAAFAVSVPGAYSLSCRTWDQQASYTVGEIPRIRGAVSALIHWPLFAVWLLGAIPGLLIMASTGRRRRAAVSVRC
ncbi:hypothetical protein [Micromonospora ureilytica]|uniref:Uncharacterized protein n=1 Tax=Micromonospora ureilytica TaxID=709868 RepID=A0ABS0JID9_9ACTN|nr:hypothetical protein [Micromonospora ureilytica]MBG6066236.1 hypothetical protein [Micromonospora ureilytica]